MKQRYRWGKKGTSPLTTVPLLLLLGLLHLSTASAETITGTFLYRDWNPEQRKLVTRPIVGARAEVWRYARRAGQYTWRLERVVITKIDGSINVTLPFLHVGARSAVKVFALNSAAQVWTPDNAEAGPYARYVGEDDGSMRVKAAIKASSILDFTYTFYGNSSVAFNAAEVIRIGHAYARAHRDPSEKERLPQVNVYPVTSTPYGRSFYDYSSQTIFVLPQEYYMDLLVLHEYGHFLEHSLSQFAWMPLYHDGCLATDGSGQVLNSPEHAWMESFANYFAAAVWLDTPSGSLHGWGSTFAPIHLDPQPQRCPDLPAEVPPEAIEAHVSGALWQLLNLRDGAGGPNDFSRNIFQIFDKELGSGSLPTISHFRDAWIARGYPLAPLNAIWEKFSFRAE